MERKRNKQIYLSYIADKKASELMLEKHQYFSAVFDNLVLQDYTQTIEVLILNVCALPPEAFPEKEKTFFRRKKKELEIRIAINYEELFRIEKDKLQKYISEIYLAALRKFLLQRKDIDAEKLCADAEKALFS